MSRYEYRIEGSICPGSQWFRPRDGAAFATREEALAAVPRYRVPGVPLGLRVRRVDLDKERASYDPRRTVAAVTAAAPVLRKRSA